MSAVLCSDQLTQLKGLFEQTGIWLGGQVQNASVLADDIELILFEEV